MKKILYTLLLPLLLMACSKDNEKLPVEQAGVRFSIDMSDFVQNRMGDESHINTLELWVFDEDGLFLESKTATLVSQSEFTAELTSSAAARRIHFVANYNLGNEAEWYGRDEREMLPMQTVEGEPERMPMWARIEVPSLEAGQNLGTITLLRNMAKFSLNIATDKLTDVSYSLFNTYNKGTICPFDPATGTFAEDTPTDPSGAAFNNDKPFVAPGTEIYGFERSNANLVQNADIACLIIKAKYDGAATHTYYKIDFVHADDKTIRYDILRNHYFRVTINNALTAGHNTIAEALAGVAANNVSLSEEVQMFPGFSDGQARIEVGATDLVFVEGQTSATVQAKYFPDITNDNTDNSKLKIDKFSGNAVSNAVVDDSGLITITLNPQPAPGEGRLRSTIVVGVDGNDDLKRIIKVEVGRYYEYLFFNVNGSPEPVNNVLTVDISNEQNAQFNIHVQLPEEFRPVFFPLSFRVYTENFYPSVASENMLLGIDNGKVYYTFTMNTMPTPVTNMFSMSFKSNKANVAEAIKVQCRYFNEQEIMVQ